MVFPYTATTVWDACTSGSSYNMSNARVLFHKLVSEAWQTILVDELPYEGTYSYSIPYGTRTLAQNMGSVFIIVVSDDSSSPYTSWVYRSTDEGDTWESLGRATQEITWLDAAQGVFFGLGWNGAGVRFVSSSDLGETWDIISTPPFVPNATGGMSLSYDDTTDTIHMAGYYTGSGGIRYAKSEDLGETWSEPVLLIAWGDTVDYWHTGIAANNGHVVVAGQEQDSDDGGYYAIVSHDNGDTWEAIATPAFGLPDGADNWYSGYYYGGGLMMVDNEVLLLSSGLASSVGAPWRFGYRETVQAIVADYTQAGSLSFGAPIYTPSSQGCSGHLLQGSFAQNQERQFATSILGTIYNYREFSDFDEYAALRAIEYTESGISFATVDSLDNPGPFDPSDWFPACSTPAYTNAAYVTAPITSAQPELSMWRMSPWREPLFFVAGADCDYPGSLPNSLAYSSDGIEWEGLGNDVFDGAVNDIFYAQKKFVAVGRGSENSIAISADGRSWTGQGRAAFDIGHAVHCNGSLWAAGGSTSGVGGVLVYSLDGEEWEECNADDLPAVFGAIAWNGHYWLAVGGTYGGDAVAFKSTDGITWTRHVSTNLPDLPSGLAWGNGVWVCGGAEYTYQNGISYSSDGETWTRVADLVSGLEPFDVKYRAGLFLAVGVGGYQAATSEDGSNWTLLPDGMRLWNLGSGGRAIAYGLGLTLMAGPPYYDEDYLDPLYYTEDLGTLNQGQMIEVFNEWQTPFVICPGHYYEPEVIELLDRFGPRAWMM